MCKHKLINHLVKNNKCIKISQHLWSPKGKKNPDYEESPLQLNQKLNSNSERAGGDEAARVFTWKDTGRRGSGDRDGHAHAAAAAVLPTAAPAARVASSATPTAAKEVKATKT